MKTSAPRNLIAPTCLALLAAVAAPERAGGADWERVLDEKFDSAASLRDWVLEGAASIAVTAGGRLEILDAATRDYAFATQAKTP